MVGNAWFPLSLQKHRERWFSRGIAEEREIGVP